MKKYLILILLYHSLLFGNDFLARLKDDTNKSIHVAVTYMHTYKGTLIYVGSDYIKLKIDSKHKKNMIVFIKIDDIVCYSKTVK